MSATRSCARPALGTIVKSGRVLNLFTVTRPEWGVSEVARTLEMPKSGAHSQLSALAEIGVLRRTSDSRYRLGWRLVSLTQTLLESAGLCDEVRPELQHLRARGGKACSAQVNVPDGSDVIVVDRVVGPDFRSDALAGGGRRLPAHSTASGKILLAYDEISEDSVNLRPLTQATITKSGELHEKLAAVRAGGIGWDFEETYPGIECVAAPVRALDGSVAAAVSISGPTGFLWRARAGYERLVAGAARRIGETGRRQDLKAQFASAAAGFEREQAARVA